MKVWLFALLESIVAAMGVVAYFWTANVYLVTVAVILATILAMAQPLINGYKQRKIQSLHDQTFQDSLMTVDHHLQELTAQQIEPPIPHRPTVLAAIAQRTEIDDGQLIPLYDELIEAIVKRETRAEFLADQFAKKVAPWSLGDYLTGLAVWALDDADAAYEHFCVAKQNQTNWIDAWYGWAATAYELGRWTELQNEHPHLKDIEWLPYGSGDENTFLKLQESDRQDLVKQFQKVAGCLGNYFTIAEYIRSKQGSFDRREKFKKAA